VEGHDQKIPRSPQIRSGATAYTRLQSHFISLGLHRPCLRADMRTNAGAAEGRRQSPARAVETFACMTLAEICASRELGAAAGPSTTPTRPVCRSRLRVAVAARRSADWRHQWRPASTAASPSGRDDRTTNEDEITSELNETKFNAQHSRDTFIRYIGFISTGSPLQI